MKKLIICIIIILVIAWFYIKRKKSNPLGKISNRPPKVRIVYSKKIPKKDRVKITGADKAVEVLRSVWSSQIEIREEMVVLLLDQNNSVMGYQVLSKGGITGTIVDSRLLFAAALKSLATAIIIAHNHPSGALFPSPQDLKLTERIKEIGELMNIRLLDHIILSKEAHFSMSDEELL